MIRFEYSADEDLLYIAFGEGPVTKTVEAGESIYFDIASDGRVIGIEFLNAREIVQSVGMPLGGDKR